MEQQQGGGRSGLLKAEDIRHVTVYLTPVVVQVSATAHATPTHPYTPPSQRRELQLQFCPFPYSVITTIIIINISHTNVLTHYYTQSVQHSRPQQGL